MPSKSRRGKANSIEAKSRMVWTNGGFALVIDRGVWPKWLQNEPHVRITEVKRPAKKGASNAKA